MRELITPEQVADEQGANLSAVVRARGKFATLKRHKTHPIRFTQEEYQRWQRSERAKETARRQIVLPMAKPHRRPLSIAK